jgi:hypothetical protein
MLFKKHFNLIAICLAIMIICVGLPLATGQDAAQTWLDSDSGLTWTVKDNGEDVSWSQGNNYCRTLDLDGHKDWRLPTIDELKSIYDKNQSKRFKAKGPIELDMATVWSSEQNKSGDVWSLNFSYGGKSLSPTGGCGSSARTLCVRKDAE